MVFNTAKHTPHKIENSVSSWPYHDQIATRQVSSSQRLYKERGSLLAIHRSLSFLCYNTSPSSHKTNRFSLLACHTSPFRLLCHERFAIPYNNLYLLFILQTSSYSAHILLGSFHSTYNRTLALEDRRLTLIRLTLRQTMIHGDGTKKVTKSRARSILVRPDHFQLRSGRTKIRRGQKYF